MKRRTFVRPEAQNDIREAAGWYEDREAGLGLRFLNEIRTSLQRIADNPLMFPIIEEDVRRCSTSSPIQSISLMNQTRYGLSRCCINTADRARGNLVNRAQ